MIYRAFALLTLLILSVPAQSLSVKVMDRELQTLLGEGEKVGSRLNVRLVENYSGPVVVFFAQTEEERKANAFPGLKSSYTGTLKDGQLTLLQVATAERSMGTATASTANTPVTLARFFAAYKLTVSVQEAGQSLTLPGLKNTDGK